MKTSKTKTLFSEEFGALYSDTTTKQLRHRFPVMIHFEDEEHANLCLFDFAADDILKWNLLYHENEEWTVKISTSAVRFNHYGLMEYDCKPRPLYRIEVL